MLTYKFGLCSKDQRHAREIQAKAGLAEGLLEDGRKGELDGEEGMLKHSGL